MSANRFSRRRGDKSRLTEARQPAPKDATASVPSSFAGNGERRQGKRAAQPSWSWLPEVVDAKFVRGLATFGLVIGLWSVVIGMKPETEIKAWVFVFVAWVSIIVSSRPVNIVGSGFGAGVMCGLSSKRAGAGRDTDDEAMHLRAASTHDRMKRGEPRTNAPPLGGDTGRLNRLTFS